MQGALGSAISAASSILAAGPYTTPAAVRGSVVILLCILAAFGTILLLPSRMDIALRRIGEVFMLAAMIFSARSGISHEANHMGVYFWIFALIVAGGAVRVISIRSRFMPPSISS